MDQNPEIAIEEPPCLLCGGLEFRLVLKNARSLLWEKPGRFNIQRCKGCGLVQTRPRPTSTSLGFYYQDTYSLVRSKYKYQTDSRIGRLIPRYRLRTLRRVCPLSGRDHLLEVGCGTGDFLRVARLQAGCKVSGIDLDATSIDNALDRDKTTYHIGSFEEVDLEPEYTVITFFHSLEHHRDPVSALKRAHALLRPGGACVIEIPNFQGWWRHVFRTYWMPLCVPQHLTHFEKPILRKAVNAAGFRRIALHRSMFYPIEGLASLFLLLWRGLRMPKRNQPDSWKWLWLILIVPLLLAWTIAVEIPTQALFLLFGRTGHQYLIAFRD